MPDFPLPAFQGWDTPHHTSVPDELFDWWLPHLSEAELKVLLYIMRRTFGFKKDSDAISLSQMRDGIMRRDGTRLDCGAGVSESSIIRGLRKLQEKGLIEVHKARTPDGDADTSVYRLRLRGPSNLTVPSSQFDRTPPANLTPPVLSNLERQDSVVQETENKRVDQIDSPVESPPPPYSPVIAGAILDLAGSLRDELAGPGAVQEALRLWQRSGLSEAAFVAALQMARGKQRRLSGVLAALTRQVGEMPG